MRLLDELRPFVVGGADGLTDLAGTIEVVVERGLRDDGEEWSLTIGNDGSGPVPVRAAGVNCIAATSGPTRMWCNGYQSWAPVGVATVGEDRDPTLGDDGFELYWAAFHADQRRARADELRSEMVTVLADRSDDLCLIGWSGGDRHDGTIRVRPAPDGAGDRRNIEVVVEAHLGGAILAAGERRTLHRVRVERGSRGGHASMLDRWAQRYGEAMAARVDAPYQVGWCSWYHYFDGITEELFDANLALASDWPFDVFQLDDGFQAAIGDWLDTNADFASPLDAIADRVGAAGRRPGIWIAPFLAHPESEVHRLHPEWIARNPDGGDPLPGGINEIWGGIVDVLDTTHPEVQAHLEELARSLVEAGFTYLKLDFTYAPSFDGTYHVPSSTPAERVRAGYDAIRRGAGEDAFLLGCGAPLGACVGVVDGMRIGPDVAPSWGPSASAWAPSGYEASKPSTRNAWRSTLARSFMHRRLWLNDPDCLMLREESTDMTSDQVVAWAGAVAVSGGMALVSDDLSLLGPGARQLLDRVVGIGREVDDAARLGPAPECVDLLYERLPTELRAAGHTLRLDGDQRATISSDTR